jgi:predicted transcriptional regulator
MALMDATPTESPVGMAVATNALLAELVDALVKQDVVTRMELANIIAAARRSVNTTKDSPAHASADVTLAKLESRFPIF